MPSDRQQTVTIPKSLWEGFKRAYEVDPEKWKAIHSIRSPTGLMVRVLRRWLYELENP